MFDGRGTVVVCGGVFGEVEGEVRGIVRGGGVIYVKDILSLSLMVGVREMISGLTRERSYDREIRIGVAIGLGVRGVLCVCDWVAGQEGDGGRQRGRG
ncbi:hypothetical protein Tco_0814078 [Tanacetum coccineum]